MISFFTELHLQRLPISEKGSHSEVLVVRICTIFGVGEHNSTYYTSKGTVTPEMMD